jgi:hypothetical protein
MWSALRAPVLRADLRPKGRAAQRASALLLSG